MSNEENALAKIEERRQEQMANMFEIADAVGAAAPMAASNFPADQTEAYFLSAQATSDEVESIDDHVGEVIELKYWFVHSVALADDSTGQKSICPRTVLFDSDGNCFAAVSTGIFSALKLLLTQLGTGELPPGFKIRFTQSKTRNKFRLLSFVPERGGAV